MDAAAVREFMLSLPEVSEYDHGGLPAFRVRGRRFASMLDDETVNLMPGDEAIRAAAAIWPGACTERFFAGRLASLGVAYPTLEPDVVRELVFEAWTHRAPKGLHAAGLAIARGG